MKLIHPSAIFLKYLSYIYICSNGLHKCYSLLTILG